MSYKNRLSAIILTASLTLPLLAGCQNTKPEEQTETIPVSETETKQQTEVSLETEPVTTETQTETKQQEQTSVFSQLKLVDFYFASGVGGWATELTVNADGSFQGNYHDSDLGDSTKDYPNGIMYYCNFSGQFTEPVKIDDLTYTTTIKALTYENKVDDSEIIDQYKYVYSEAYGLAGGKTFYIYLPGKETSTLPEDYVSWYQVAVETADGKSIYNAYGIYNEEEEVGFCGYERPTGEDLYTRAKEYTDYIKEEADKLTDRLENEDLDQSTMNKLSKELYDLWDSALNSVYSDLKQELSEEAMNTLRTEERAWISEKEAAVKKAVSENEGGSIAALIEYTTAASLTKDRVYELLSHLEEAVNEN